MQLALLLTSHLFYKIGGGGVCMCNQVSEKKLKRAKHLKAIDYICSST